MIFSFRNFIVFKITSHLLNLNASINNLTLLKLIEYC